MSLKRRPNSLYRIFLSLCLLLAMAWQTTPVSITASPLASKSQNPQEVSSPPSTQPSGNESLIFTAITLGSSSTCGLLSGGGAKCWGYNFLGQLGDGTQTSHSSPVDVFGLTSGVTAIEAGSDHTCALLAGGGVKCWGANWDGELGDGTSDNTRLTPVDVVGLSGSVTAISAGSQHTCVLLSTTGVMCWGRNYYGQLGDGTSEDPRTTPVDVIGLTSGVLAISANGIHTCALLASGGLKCWGNNEYGQLGDGTNSNSNTPVEVSGLVGGVITVNAGGTHTCALLASGGLKCWGNNAYGQLGDGANLDHNTPVDVVGLAGDVTAIAAGGEHTCALLTTGGMQCWGFNLEGELGDGTTLSRANPGYVKRLTSGVTAIAASSMHTCALIFDGRIKCWGDGWSGKLGNAVISYRAVPMDVVSLQAGVTDIVGGARHTCALLAGGGVQCWGANGGQLGDGTNVNYRSTPVDVIDLAGGATAIAAGQDHTCAALTVGGAKCWGWNYYGQLGNGTTADSHTPVVVSGLTDEVSAITAGWFHTCALMASGGMKCWGGNSYGQLGDGTIYDQLTPVDVSGLTSGVLAITAGLYHTCALLSSGGVKCWGDTGSNIPVDVIGLESGAIAIAAGDVHTCALMAGGGMKCWGGNYNGQLGDGTYEDHLTPVDVYGLTSGVTAIAAGANHTCALLTSGGMKCWGDNWWGSGQLGDGTTTEYSNIPVDVTGLSRGVSVIAAGGVHTCALVGAGRPKCWGSDWYYELGTGRPTECLTPVIVAESSLSLTLNYYTGRPGSIFTLTGWDFPPGSTLTLSINGQVITTTLSVNPTGSFIVFLDTTGVQAGGYAVRVGDDPDGSTGFFLAEDAPLRSQEGGGLIYSIPPGVIPLHNFLYLPTLMSEK